MIEIFKNIIGYEGYQISNLGRVKSLPRKYVLKERIRKLRPDVSGYLILSLWRKSGTKTVKVHRLVTQAFLPNPQNKPHTNHINGIKSDNRVENLEHCTASENGKHAYKIGLATGGKGEKNSMAKLNEKQVRVIKHWKIINPKITSMEVAKVFNIAFQHVCAIWNGQRWNHITI